MKIFLVANGNVYKLREFVNYLNPEIVIAVNGGTNKSLKNSVIPDIIIGDTDSLQKSIKLQDLKSKIIKYPRDKDQNDLDLAVSYIITTYCNFMLFSFGVIGNRIDHTLANLYSLAKINEKKCFSIIVGSKETIFYLVNQQVIKNIPLNTRVSVISLEKLSLVKMQGLKYSGNFEIPLLSSLGISNYVNDNLNFIECLQGKVIIIIYKNYRELNVELKN